MTRNTKQSLLCGLAAGAIWAVPVHAQTAETTPDETAGGEPRAQGGLAEIVVTAQKRAENVQDVPIAITALAGQFLEDTRVRNLLDLTNTLPNVQINSFSNSPDSAVFTIRGIGVNDADPYVGTTVSVVVDGVVVGINTAALCIHPVKAAPVSVSGHWV